MPNNFDFDWDDGNTAKSQKHGVSIKEIEELFENIPLVNYDHKNSIDEDRFRAAGTSNNGRYVFVVFTIRDNDLEEKFIRVISARYMHEKEMRRYETERQKQRQ
jgi:uncharacterized DUF497 family protein